jgi:hypothetical protein
MSMTKLKAASGVLLGVSLLQVGVDSLRALAQPTPAEVGWAQAAMGRRRF